MSGIEYPIPIHIWRKNERTHTFVDLADGAMNIPLSEFKRGYGHLMMSVLPCIFMRELSASLAKRTGMDQVALAQMIESIAEEWRNAPKTDDLP